MGLRNQLFFISFAAIAASGCGTVPPSPAEVAEARPATASKQAAPAPSVAAPRAPASAGRETDMLFHALMAAGVDYRRGGKSHQSGFDCSGLVVHVYREAYGVALPHSTLGQSAMGDVIERSALLPGDLVFFNTLGKPYTHVGIYVGEGRFIHAPREGTVVRTESLQARYWASRFDGARRIAPSVTTADYPLPAKKPVVTYP